MTTLSSLLFTATPGNWLYQSCFTDKEEEAKIREMASPVQGHANPLHLGLIPKPWL